MNVLSDKSETFQREGFHKSRLLKSFVEICNIELRENSTDLLSPMSCNRRTACRLCSACNTFLNYKAI